LAPANAHAGKASSIGADLSAIARDKCVADYGDEVPGDKFPGSVRSFVEESDESVVIRISERDVPSPARIEVDQGSGASVKKIPVRVKPGKTPMFVNIKAFVMPGDEKIMLRVFDRADEQISSLEWNVERAKCYGVTLRRADR
jgi:hypothetical protein